MHRWSKNPPFGRMATLACIALAFCLFAWGLQYKLSLYDPPQAASHQVPTAKLLSQSEKSRSTESPLVVRTRTSTKVIYTAPTAVVVILLLALGILNPPLSAQRQQRANCLWQLRRAHLRAYFVRPPPVLVLATLPKPMLECSIRSNDRMQRYPFLHLRMCPAVPDRTIQKPFRGTFKICEHDSP